MILLLWFVVIVVVVFLASFKKILVIICIIIDASNYQTAKATGSHFSPRVILQTSPFCYLLPSLSYSLGRPFTVASLLRAIVLIKRNGCQAIVWWQTFAFLHLNFEHFCQKCLFFLANLNQLYLLIKIYWCGQLLTFSYWFTLTSNRFFSKHFDFSTKYSSSESLFSCSTFYTIDTLKINNFHLNKCISNQFRSNWVQSSDSKVWSNGVLPNPQQNSPQNLPVILSSFR